MDRIFSTYLTDDPSNDRLFDARVQRILHGKGGTGGGGGGIGGAAAEPRPSRDSRAVSVDDGIKDGIGPPETHPGHRRGSFSYGDDDSELRKEDEFQHPSEHKIEHPSEFIDWDAIDALLETS